MAGLSHGWLRRRGLSKKRPMRLRRLGAVTSHIGLKSKSKLVRVSVSGVVCMVGPHRNLSLAQRVFTQGESSTIACSGRVSARKVLITSSAAQALASSSSLLTMINMSHHRSPSAPVVLFQRGAFPPTKSAVRRAAFKEHERRVGRHPVGAAGRVVGEFL